MDYGLHGKCAFVSAGAHGIGEAISDLLTQEGARVVVADLDGAALEEKEKAHRWEGVITADLSSATGVDKAVAYVLDTFGRAPDILVNNLGVGNAASFEEISDQTWELSFQINLMGCVRLCRALAPKMAEIGGSAVVNIASDLAKQPEPTMMDYGTCKAGLLYFTKALALQYAPRLRVQCCSSRTCHDEDVDASWRHRRSARCQLWTRQTGRELIGFSPSATCPSASESPKNVLCACRGLSCLAACKVYYGCRPGYWGNPARPHLKWRETIRVTSLDRLRSSDIPACTQ